MRPSVKIWTFRAVALSIAIGASALGGEALVRTLAPQDLSTAWLEPGPRGLILNRADATARHQRGDRIVAYRFNSFHLRGGPVRSDGRRVLVLGDSFTFGWLLPEEDTYVARLEAAMRRDFGLQAAQFLNGGVGGWGTADQLAYLELFGDRINPDAVIVFLNFGDVDRSQTRGLYALLDRDRLTLDPRDVSSIGASFRRAIRYAPGYQWLLAHSHLMQLIRRTIVEIGDIGHADRGPPTASMPPSASVAALETDRLRLTRALFRRMKAWCDSRNAHLFVLTTGWPIPDGQWLSAALDEERIAFRDLAPALSMASSHRLETLTIPSDGHPNREGAELIARLAWEWLRSEFGAKWGLGTTTGRVEDKP